MNFDVKFDNCPLHFSAKFIEDDSSFEGFGQDLQLIHGKDGKSAYEVAVANGFEGTEAEWLESLHGKDGQDGKDGAPGRDGQDGQPGRDGLDGKDYILTEADKQEIAEQAAELIDVPEGGEGTTDHSKLTNRDAADQHPIEAITGLADALKAKLTKDDVDSVLAQAKESGEFDGKDGKDGLDGQPGKDGQDGYTPVKGKDYYTEADKAELVEEVLEQIPEQPSGGISVDKAEIGQTIVVKAVDENGKPTEWEAADLPEGGAAIIDVTELPTENINEDVFYRLLSGTFYYNGTPQPTFTCYIVESLPTEGVPVTTDMVHVSLYYSVDTGSVSGYIPADLGGMMGVPAGWYPVEAIAQAFDLAWGGIIWSEHEDPSDDATRLVLSYAVYQFKHEWNNLSEKVGWRGTGGGSEIFNSLRNTASGSCSHAEGSSTTASESCSHAEGMETTASGSQAHAEGNSTTASGDHGSHAEGNRTTASGRASHAEGWYIIAAGEDQHAQGRYNIEDLDSKYAHIVGNGTFITSRSNAHTLDWSGLGWFAGGLKVGGTGQDDENAQSVVLSVNGQKPDGTGNVNVAGGSGSSVQSDWNQNDESQPDYVKNRPFYEVPRIYDITWDGDMTGRPALDLSLVGMDGAYLVKVSDKVYTKEELLGKFVSANDGMIIPIDRVEELEDIVPGSFSFGSPDFGVVYSADEFNAAVGAPDGYYTNGTYFWCAPSEGLYVSALYTEGHLEKLEDKFLPDTALRRVYINVPNADTTNALRCTLDGGWSERNVTWGEGSPWGESPDQLFGKELQVRVSVYVSENTAISFAALFSPVLVSNMIGSCFVFIRNGELMTQVQLFIRIMDAGTVYVAAKTVDI